MGDAVIRRGARHKVGARYGAGARRARALTRCAALLLLSSAWPAPLVAQVAVGDSLWKMGRTSEAAVAYQRAIETDRYSVRANVLTARTLAWSSNFDSALVLLRNARVRVPDDPDIRYTEALYLSWAKRFDDALIRYDSLLRSNSDLDYVRVARARTLSWAGRLGEAEGSYRAALALPMKDQDATRDARIGLAQVSAWRGDLVGASAKYAALLADDATDARSLTGLASVRTWQGRPRAAVSLLERALARDSANAETKTALAVARVAAAPRTNVEVNWSRDSDADQNVWTLAAQRFFLSDWLAASTTAGVLQASDAVRHANRTLGEIALAASGDVLRGSASLGARALNPDSPGVPERTVLTARLSGSMRLGAGAILGASVARFPFDEIASLLARAIDLTAVDANLDLTPWRGSTIALSAGTLGFSDGNRRTNGIVRVAQRWPDRPWLGAYARTTSFSKRVAGYFSPGHFSLYELQGGWEREAPVWSGSLGVGYGSQKVDTDKPWQSEYHAEGRLARSWPGGNSVALTGGVSTSAVSSAVGAFRYSTLGLSATIVW